MKKIVLTLLFICLSNTLALANETIIENGFKAYKETDIEGAWKAWSKGNPLEGTLEMTAQMSQAGKITAYYGKYVSHEYVKTKELSPRNKIVYVIANLENGPLFLKFLLYKKADDTWTIPNFLMHTIPEQILPKDILE